MVKAALILIFGLLVAFNAAAQQTRGDSASRKSARPLWSELSPKQQAVLAPLAGEWESLDSQRRKKWVTIADRYSSMNPDEQRRLQTRMQDWANLTPAQRRVARENYQSLKQLPRPQRGEIKQKWRQSQEATTEVATPDAPGR